MLMVMKGAGCRGIYAGFYVCCKVACGSSPFPWSRMLEETIYVDGDMWEHWLQVILS